MNADELANLVILSVSPDYARERCLELIGFCLDDAIAAPARYRVTFEAQPAPLRDQLNRLLDLLIEEKTAPDRAEEILRAGMQISADIEKQGTSWIFPFWETFAPQETPFWIEMEQALETAVKGVHNHE